MTATQPATSGVAMLVPPRTCRAGRPKGPAGQLRDARTRRQHVRARRDDVGLDAPSLVGPRLLNATMPSGLFSDRVATDRVRRKIVRPVLAVGIGLVRPVVLARADREAILRRAGRRHRVGVDWPFAFPSLPSLPAAKQISMSRCLRRSRSTPGLLVVVAEVA